MKTKTVGELYGPAMKVDTKEEAEEMLLEITCYIRSRDTEGKTEEQITNIAKCNLGYYAGYYDHDTRRRVERLYECAHPVFGSIAANGPPTASEAFAAGKKLGEKAAK